MQVEAREGFFVATLVRTWTPGGSIHVLTNEATTNDLDSWFPGSAWKPNAVQAPPAEAHWTNGQLERQSLRDRTYPGRAWELEIVDVFDKSYVAERRKQSGSEEVSCNALNGFSRWGFCLIAGILLSSLGCSMSAPMYVWQPPLNQQRVIQSIALAPLHGDQELAAKLDKAMIESQPSTGNAITLLHPKLLEEITSIQLASFDGHPSDLAGLSAARRANADVLVQGQIVRARLDPQEPKRGRFDFRKRPSEELVVSWTITDVASGERLKSEILTLDRETSEILYPDIKGIDGDPVDRVVTAVSRQSWKVFSPMANKEDAVLALPWVSLGASRTRQGNAYARQGRWDLAEENWQDVAAKHPRNNAAWNNLALAAAAREDFELARDRVEHAKSIVPWDRARKTERWIDEHQHNYHRALGLPDRDGGWLIPDPPPPKPLEEVPPVEIQDIDKLPWWTTIPGTKPPGWTWWQWLTQPRVM